VNIKSVLVFVLVAVAGAAVLAGIFALTVLIIKAIILIGGL